MTGNRPLLSICIPTYNRYFYLNNLFENLFILKQKYGEVMEVCVSDNNSPDETQSVIKRWRDKLSLNDILQHKNIGGNLNTIEVLQIASGRWVLIMGDDDEIIPKTFDILLQYLKNLTDTELVLLGVTNPVNNENLLGHIQTGLYSDKKFRNILLDVGLFRFGFLGMYVFHYRLISELVTSNSKVTKSWPHLLILLQHLCDKKSIRVFSSPVVIQDALKGDSFWEINDWVSVNFTKIDVINAIKCSNTRKYFFCKLLTLRELYSIRNLKDLYLCRIYNYMSFKVSTFGLFAHIYKGLGYFKLLSLPHHIYMIILLYLPSFFDRILLYAFRNSDVIKFYGKKNSVENNCAFREPS